MLYMVTFTINIPPMLAYIPYMDPMGHEILRTFLIQSWGGYVGPEVRYRASYRMGQLASEGLLREPIGTLRSELSAHLGPKSTSCSTCHSIEIRTQESYVGHFIFMNPR